MVENLSHRYVCTTHTNIFHEYIEQTNATYVS